MFLPGNRNFWTTSLMNRLSELVRSRLIGCSLAEQPCAVFSGDAFGCCVFINEPSTALAALQVRSKVLWHIGF